MFETVFYKVVKIDGDYAYLVKTDTEEEPKLVARALLPEGIMEGSKLKYELMQYELYE
ncbi:MAG: chorismate--pyruvate lyase [Eubacterium sp.]|nr:chorismate--pyruvate lyase [Eubacterium sp.]NBI87899.1 chorismate--pyruvate lyase [Lachnospiraceae bacterium]